MSFRPEDSHICRKLKIRFWSIPKATIGKLISRQEFCFGENKPVMDSAIGGHSPESDIHAQADDF